MFDNQNEQVQGQCHICKDKEELLEMFDNCFPLAQAYVPFQSVHTLFSPEVGLVKGTVFPELYRPYAPRNRHLHTK